MNMRAFRSAGQRRSALEKELHITLPNIGAFTLDEPVASGRNCENMIGATQIPIGIAGPLLVAGKRYFIPLATTEGALVASVNRGCKAISKSGGAVVDSLTAGATRGPVFRVKDLRESKKLQVFLKTHIAELKNVASQTSGHLTLVDFLTRGVGRYRFVRFVFHTGEAMGMNMVTIATQAVVDYIEKKTGIRCLAVAGNFDIDKKPSWLNIIENRGTKVWAAATLTSAVLEKVLKTTSKSLYDVWLAKCMIGSAISGSMGFNAHIANIIAAVFAATGQDLGHIGEGSCGITTMERSGDDLYASVVLPDLMVGIVGGGTGLATQKEALSIIGAKTSREFAQVVGAAALAGEISLLASLAQGSLVNAHRRLGRGEKL